MAETHERLRSDLEIRPESSEANAGVIVKDPITRRFYRFTSIQASVLALLGGHLNLCSIAQSVSQKHHVVVSEKQLEEFVQRLHALSLLDHPSCWNNLEHFGRSKHRLGSNLLSIKIHAFNPDKFLTKLEAKLRFCFSPICTILAWITIAFALVVSISNWESLFFSFGTLLSVYSIPLIVIVAFTVMTIHEFGHGLALKHFGGKVEEMGFMVLYFVPAFYCNVSDAWMLKKRERVLVTLAGSYVQTFVWAFATLFWRLLSAEVFLSRVCLIVIAFSGIQILLNFIPLIRLDGYYLLSDCLEVPNLRQKAFTYLKNKLRALLTGIPFASEAGLSRSEKRIYWFFGTASALFTVVLLGVTFRHLGSWMVKEYRTWGVLLMTGVFFMAVPIANKDHVLASGRLLSGILKRLRQAPITLVVFGLIIAAGFLPWELKISGDFTVLPLRRVSITPQVDGNLRAIYVEQGSRVYAGQVLGEIENLEVERDYGDTKGELGAQQATLDLLKSGTRPEEIERAKRLVETKRAELRNATRIEQERTVLLDTIAKKEAELSNSELIYERTKSLLQSGLVARNEADRDRTAYEVQKRELAEAKGQLRVLEDQAARTQDVKRKELAQAQSELKILLAGSREEEVRAVESEVSKLQDKLLILKRELERLKIRSPIDGIVATSYLRNRIGDYLDKGDMFCQIVSEGRMLIDLPVPEKEIADVRTGLPITLRVRGFPKRFYQARVTSIAPIATENGLERTVLVQGMLENPDGSLKAGMTGVGKILCGKRMIFALASRRAIRWLRTEFWEYLP